MRVQAGVVQALDTTRVETNTLVTSSQSAAGILQASQSGNQLIALQTRQLVDLTALLAAQSRAQSLESARLIANQEQGRVQLNQFLTTSRGYQAQPVQMFNR
jgi:P-type conjugative transfer protein TrbJ